MRDCWRTFFIVLLAVFVSSSCAKKMDSGGNKPEPTPQRNQEQINPEIEDYFQAQKAECKYGCKPSIAKIVVFERGKVDFCTGTLIAPDTIVTSSNCLPRHLKLPGVQCVNNVAAVFPEHSGLETEIAYCDEIVESSVLDDRSDPALWRGDFAYIKLKKPVKRRPLRISRGGIKRGGVYTTYKMEFKDQTHAVQESEKCFPLFNSYANPYSQQQYSPMITMTECHIREANLGAPVFDSRGRIVGLLSSKLDKSLTTYVNTTDIMSEPVAPIQHVSNFACADIPLNWYSGYSMPDECYKRLDSSGLIRARAHILNSQSIHQANMREVERRLEIPDKYFQWDVQFLSKNQGAYLEAHLSEPRCFHGIIDWIGEFSGGIFRRKIYTYGKVEVYQPHFVLRTKLTRHLHPVSVIIEGRSKSYTVEFNPANAYFNNVTDVTVTGDLGGRSQSKTYPGVDGNCVDK